MIHSRRTLKNLDMSDWSQCGEQKILESLFEKMGVEKGKSVEFGGGDAARQSNTRWCLEAGWDSHFWDISPANDKVEEVEVTPANINTLIEDRNLNESLDLLSIDIDGNDYWVWEVLKYQPKVVILEFNPCFDYGVCKTIEYDPEHRFDRTRYYGASFGAMMKLAEKKGYAYYANTPLNIIFVKKSLSVESIMEPFYKVKSGWAPDKLNRKWVTV